MDEENDDIVDIGGVCIKCNLPVPKLMKMIMTIKGEICYVCDTHKGKMYPQHCKKCGLDWFSILYGQRVWLFDKISKGKYMIKLR